MFVGLTGFSLAWASIGIAQLLTGYSWKNMAEGNRGPHKHENPGKFWLSVGIDFAISLAACLVALRQLFKE
jgi:hypothetical protein